MSGRYESRLPAKFMRRSNPRSGLDPGEGEVTTMEAKTYYITTAIDYVNASPHIGHAYEKILADVLARFHRLLDHDVYFLTGTDEHGQKNATSAQAVGKDVSTFVGENAARFRELAQVLNLSIDDFIRTTEARHARGVRGIWERVAAAGDFYKKNYKALYCVGHEAFVTKSDLVDGKCPDHGTEPLVIEEENYFFRLSKYRQQLRRLFEERPDFVLPQSRWAEMLNLIDTLEDISVSRPVEKLSWGIPVPGDPSHVIYVWFDALTNYISAIGFGGDETRFHRLWPANAHVIGKDINRFHSLLWPAMLISAGIQPPRQILVHGFLTVDRQKISKSLGNTVDLGQVAQDLAATSGAEFAVCVDAVRYFLLREIPFGEDGDFNRSALIHRFNADLANDYGNLLNRTLPLVDRYFQGQIPPRGREEGSDATLHKTAADATVAVTDSVSRVEFSRALGEIWQILGAANKYIDEEAPWQAIKTSRERTGTILYNTLEAVRIATILLNPWLPTATARVWEQLGIKVPLQAQRLKDAQWGGLLPGTRAKPSAPIFPRIERRVPAAVVSSEKGESEAVDHVKFDDFKKLDIRVAEVISAVRVPGAEKLVELKVDIGGEVRTLAAGLIPQYRADELIGKRIIVLVNLEPRRLRGIDSQGMLLAAEWNGQVALLTVERDAPKGSKVS